MRKLTFQLAIALVVNACLGIGSSAHADLVNHWKFDEAGGTATATDSGSGGLDLTLQGDADFTSDATRGQVLALDGAGDYASNAAEPFTGDGTFTIAGWVNHFDAGALTQKWISWGQGGARLFLGPWSNNYDGCVFFGVGNQNGFFTDASAKPAEDTWQYWTLVREGTSASLYLDGELVQTLTVSNTASMSTDGQLRLGCQYTTGECLRGLMDDWAIWNEALAPEQIANAMNYGADNYMVPEPSTAALLLAVVLGACAVLRPRRRVTE